MLETSGMAAVHTGDRARGDPVGDAVVAPVMALALTEDIVVDRVVLLGGEKTRVGGAKTGGEGVAGNKRLCTAPFFLPFKNLNKIYRSC